MTPGWYRQLIESLTEASDESLAAGDRSDAAAFDSARIAAEHRARELSSDLAAQHLFFSLGLPQDSLVDGWNASAPG